MGVLSLMSSTVSVLPLPVLHGGYICFHFNCIWVCYHIKLNCLRVKASSIACSVSVLSRQLHIGMLSLVMSSTVCVLPLSVLHTV